jgi:hypothetical protein
MSSGLIFVGVLYLGYCGSLVTGQRFRYDWFPPSSHGKGTKHHIPDMAPPLLA